MSLQIIPNRDGGYYVWTPAAPGCSNDISMRMFRSFDELVDYLAETFGDNECPDLPDGDKNRI